MMLPLDLIFIFHILHLRTIKRKTNIAKIMNSNSNIYFLLSFHLSYVYIALYKLVIVGRKYISILVLFTHKISFLNILVNFLLEFITELCVWNITEIQNRNSCGVEENLPKILFIGIYQTNIYQGSF